MNARCAVVLLALTGCPSGAQSVGSRVTTITRAPSGKTLAIYQSSTFETEPREVPEEVVVQGMRSSSMFFEEDIRALVPEIVATLPKLEDDQRIVIETSDTAVHVFVAAASNELQFVSFRQGHEVSRHASAIPAAAVKTELAVKPKSAPPQPQPQPAPQPQPVVEPVKTEPVAQTKPPTRKPATNPPTKPAAKPAAGPKLTEIELRAKLDELERLRTKNLITNDEYQQRRKALLDRL